ncbi:hypothetical protein [Sorangium sp. So ce1000]|uniref:hypothetical protein n=1 Tax=Sorangium sp. So ce1000 TaxID=3133325 RepID=UPI003F5D7C12
MASDKDDAIDADAILRMALEQAAKPRPDGTSRLSNMVNSIHAVQWLLCLAAPRVFLRMKRMPPREHLLRMVDFYLAYVRRGERNLVPEMEPVPYEQRETLALQLRALLETWSPPGLPAEISEAARAVLHADGQREPPGGWDEADEPTWRPEEELLWPEGVPAAMRPSDPGDRDR